MQTQTNGGSKLNTPSGVNPRQTVFPSAWEKVKAFQQIVGSRTPDNPEFPSHEDTDLIIRVLDEEVSELFEALLNQTDLNNLVKELTDCLTGVLLAAVYCGVNIDKAFDLTFRSHLSKLIDSNYSSNGKLLKGPNYLEPDFSFMIADDE